MIYQSDAEILYPNHVTPSLRNLRSKEWREYVDWVLTHPGDHEVVLAFTLAMVRLDGCLTCHADSFRAMRGCAACAQQAITRYKGSDKDLIGLFEVAQSDLRIWVETGEIPLSEQVSDKMQQKSNE